MRVPTTLLPPLSHTLPLRTPDSRQWTDRRSYLCTGAKSSTLSSHVSNGLYNPECSGAHLLLALRRHPQCVTVIQFSHSGPPSEASLHLFILSSFSPAFPSASLPRSDPHQTMPGFFSQRGVFFLLPLLLHLLTPSPPSLLLPSPLSLPSL